MPKVSQLFSETIRLDESDYLNLKNWLHGKKDYNGVFLTKKELHKLIIRTFLARPDWQKVIVDHLDFKRQTYEQSVSLAGKTNPKNLHQENEGDE